jgi:hypothetical protein
MKCPKCNAEMERGHFTLPNNVTWYPGDRKTGFAKDQVWLVGRWTLFGDQAEGYICQKCRWASFQYPHETEPSA